MIYDKDHPMSDEEFEKQWMLAMEKEEKRRKKWGALPEEKKRLLEKEFSDPFYERISDNPLGDDSKD